MARKTTAGGNTYILRPRVKADISAVPGRAVAVISNVSKVHPVPGMAVAAGGATMIVEQVLGHSETNEDDRYVILRPPAMWTMRGTTTVAFIRGWPHELQSAVPELRRLPARKWSEREVADAVAKATGRSILVSEPGVRMFHAVLDAVLDASEMDRLNEWRIKVGLERITETSGF